MALQDLTPQLRTRLSRMERAVGWFVILATVLLAFGFGYYIFNTAHRKGWFTPKFKYQTSLNSAAGLKPGDPVKLMGSPAGQITEIIPNAPAEYYGVTVNFSILKPHYGYIWDDSMVKVSSDFLGNRFLEITKGIAGVATIAEDTNRVPQAMLRWKVAREIRKKVLAGTRTANPDLEQTNILKFNWIVMDELKRQSQADSKTAYTNLTEVYWIEPAESPALNERLERVAEQIEKALPNILSLTNQLMTVLSNSANMTSNLNILAVNARPAVSNLATLLAGLDKPGALGDWLLPTNINRELEGVLIKANGTVEGVNTNLPALFESLDQTLSNLADMTSNLNNQVEANTNILSNISQAVVNTDDLVQGLKRHWLLRSAFKTKTTNAPPPIRSEPGKSPKGGSGR